MKTEQLIDLLATGIAPAAAHPFGRRLLRAGLVGFVASVGLAALLAGLNPAASLLTSATWMKLGYVGLVALAAGALCARLARPLADWRIAAGGLAAVVIGMAGLAAAVSGAAPPGQRLAVWLGHSWLLCPLLVALLSLPALGITLRALRGLAPMRPLPVAAAAGVFAGAVGALGYALACDEVAAPFVAAWYTLGIAVVGGLGALAGPRLLRV